MHVADGGGWRAAAESGETLRPGGRLSCAIGGAFLLLIIGMPARYCSCPICMTDGNALGTIAVHFHLTSLSST